MLDEPRRADRALDLTENEHIVLKLIADGWADKAIALALDVSVRTVNTVRDRLLQKTGSTTRVQLARFAVAEGIVPVAWPPSTLNGPWKRGR